MQICSARNIVYGAVRSMLSLGDGLKNAGHEVEYLTFAGRGAGPQLRERGEIVHEARVRFKLDPVSIGAMAKVLKDRNIDVVHTHLSTSSVNGALAARAAGLPSVATVHGLSGRLSFTFATRCIAVSEQVKKHLIAQGTSASVIRVVYNGIEIPEFRENSRSESKASLGLADRSPVIGTVSRITALKGISDAIEAFSIVQKRFPAAFFILIGDGDAVAECERKITELGLGGSVRLYGYKSPIDPYMRAMDIFVFPSHKEAMGIALVEAAAFGLPIVATEVGGIPEVVSEDIGLLVPAHAPHLMGEALLNLAGDEKMRLRMGMAGRDRAQRLFSERTMVDRTIEVYREVIEERAAAPAKKRMAQRRLQKPRPR